MRATYATAHSAGRTRWLLAIDLLLVAAAFAGAYAGRFGRPFLTSDHLAHEAAHLLMGLAAFALWPPALFLLDLYNPARFHTPLRLLGRILQASILVALLTATVLFLFKAKLASRLVFVLYVGGAAGLLWLARLATGYLAARGTRGLRVLIVGAGPAAQRAAAALQQSGRQGVALVGHLSVADERSAVAPERVVGARDDLARVLEQEVVDLVLIAVPSARIEEMGDVVASCSEVGVDVAIAADFFERILAHGVPGRLFELPVVSLFTSPQFRAVMLSKRAFDIVVGLPLLVLATPIMLLAALLVRLTSPGPVLFVQERIGLHGRRFKFYKLRTMVEGAEQMREALAPLNEMNGPAFKLRHDPRVTRVGRLLRRLSIDELPQLWNVLRGDMSLVGPRPPVPEEVARYDRRQQRRLSIRPGLTCTWQVSGRSDVDFDAWVRLDLDYIDNWSPWLDLKILLRTVPAVLSGRGAR
ncbi:MAG: sugar transferase [Planctomycetota bacterium]|jgi:exopolysaccharide biosynthesis polyprenyl glycosylphosphotransferase